jgi:sugar phosphate isomerase/epimerase
MMRLAYSSNAYMKFSMTQAIERIARIGYAGVELMADVPHAWPLTTGDAEIETIRRSLADASLTISNINAFMMNAVQDFWHPSWIEPDEDYRRQRIEHTKRSLTMARKLGATCITTEPGGPMDDGMSRAWAMDTFAEGLSEALKHAESEGVLLLVEPEPELLIENSEQFLELASRIDSPMFGLNFDIGHFYCVDDLSPETIIGLKNHTRHYHFEDIAASRVHEHLVPGAGAIDFKSVIETIRQTDYDGWLTVELYPYLDDPDGAGRAAIDHLRPLIESQ